jgi:uncharacterized protein (DUF1810 family)
MNYSHLRNQLSAYLHQDYDLDTGTAADAIIAAIKTSSLPLMVEELSELQHETDETVHEVLNDHSVEIWGLVSPRELLSAMKVFATLYLEEAHLRGSETGREGL